MMNSNTCGTCGSVKQEAVLFSSRYLRCYTCEPVAGQPVKSAAAEQSPRKCGPTVTDAVTAVYKSLYPTSAHPTRPPSQVKSPDQISEIEIRDADSIRFYVVSRNHPIVYSTKQVNDALDNHNWKVAGSAIRAGSSWFTCSAVHQMADGRVHILDYNKVP